MPLSYSLVRNKIGIQIVVLSTTTSTVYAVGATSNLGSTQWISASTISFGNQYPWYGTCSTVDVVTPVAIGATSHLGSTNWGETTDLPITTTSQTQSGVTRITASPVLPSYSSIPGTIRLGRMVFGAARNIETPNSTASIPNLGGFLGQYGLGQFTPGGGAGPTYTAYFGTPAPINLGSILGFDGPGGFQLGTYATSGGLVNQNGIARIAHIGILKTRTGVTNIQPFIRPQRHQLGKCRISHLGIKRTQFGRMNIASPGSITSEIVIQNVAYTTPPTTGQSEITLSLPGAGSAIGGSNKFRVVQSAQSVRNATSLAFPGNVTSGNILIALLGVAAGMTNPPPMHDTLGNTWTQAIYSSISGEALSFMWTTTSSSGANTITVTDATFGTGSSQIILAEVYGDIIPVVDVVGNSAGGQATVTTTNAADVLFGALMGYGGTDPVVQPGYWGDVLIQAVPSVGYDYEIALAYRTNVPAGSWFNTLQAGGYWAGVYVNYIAVAFKQGYKYAIADNNALGGNERSTYGNYQRLKKGALIGQTSYRPLTVALSPGYYLPTMGSSEWSIVQENLDVLTATSDTFEASCVQISALPLLYGNTSVYGTSLASTIYNGNYDAWIAFTFGTILWGWLTNGSALPQWIQYQFTAQETISTYRITPWSVDTFPSRSPSAWLLQGSNDGSSWTTLDTQSSFTNWIISTPTIFTITSPQPFYYYRLYVTANGGDTYTAIKTLSLHKVGDIALSKSIGAYRRHKNIVTNDVLGAYNHAHVAEYTIAAGVTLPLIGSGYALGHALSQLFHVRHLNVNKFLPVDTEPYTKFHLFPNTYNAWPAMSTFTGTLATETFNSTSLMVYDAKATQAVRLAAGGTVPGGFEADGSTDVAVHASQVTTGDWSASCVTSFALTPNALVPYGWEADAVSTVAFTAERDGYASIQCDGSTDVKILSIGGFGWEADGSTDVEFTVDRGVYGFFHMDGSTDCEITSTGSNWAGHLNMDGITSITITASQIYSFGNTLSMDGAESVSIVANQAYGFGIQIQILGSGSCEFVNVERAGVVGFDATGQTAVQFGSIADYFINLGMDGATTVAFNSAYYPIIQILCTGVGDAFINALIGHFASLNMDGNTQVIILGLLEARGFLQWYTGIQTSVTFGSAKTVSAYVDCDGSTAVSFNPNQDSFGILVVDQIDQELYALGTFTYPDGQLNVSTGSSLTSTSKYFPIAPYISGIIQNIKDTGSPDFVPNGTISFTASGKTARSQGEGIIGVMNYKRAVGPVWGATTYNRMPMRSQTTQEYVRFPLFVSEAIDFPQISGFTGFTTAGISAVGGFGVVGRDKEEYVTLAILTNTRMTQAALEILAFGNPKVDLTQVCYEMLFIPNSNCFATQVIEEVLYLANLAAINGEAIETLAGGNGGSGYTNSVVVEVVGGIHANTLMSQTVKEVLATGDPYARISQVATEMLVYSQVISYSNVLLNCVVIETVMAPEGNLLINSETVEILNNGQGHLDVNSVVLEIVNNGSPRLRVNDVVLEEINNSTTQALCVNGISIECLVLFETDYTVASMVNNPRYHI